MDKPLTIQEPARLLTVAEAAQRLGLARKSLYNLMSAKSDDIPRYKRYRGKPMFLSSDISRFIEDLPYD